MISGWMRVVVLLALAPAAASAFETVDQIPYPSRGGFPDAYPPDPTFPTTLWAQAGLMFDSNPFRLSDSTNTRAVLGKDERSDAVMRYGVGAGHVGKIVGRQSVRLSARGEYFDYLRYNTLDHFAYGLGAEWLWEVTNDLSGSIGYGRAQGLADPAEVQRPVKDEITTDRIFADAVYRLGPSFRLRGGAAQDRGKREGDRPKVYTQGTTLRAGVDYFTGLGNAIGVEARRSEGTAPLDATLDPTGQFANNEFQEEELSVVLSYALGAQLTVGGRVGHTRRTYTEVVVQEFDATTGRLSIGWRPEPKLSFTFDVYREPRAILDVDAAHVDVRGMRFGPAWAPTLKLVFSAQFVNERRRFQASTDGSLAPRDDTMRIWRFAVGWEPQRHFTVGTGLDYGKRESNTLGRDFDYVAAMANLRYDW
jgi:hypothetical protein